MATHLIKPDRILRSRRKTIALIMELDGTLEVRAPQQMTDKDILEFVQSKTNWIRKRQATIQAGPPPHAFQQGEQFYYLGKLYPLRYVENQGKSVMFRGTSIDMRVSARPEASAKIEAWYRAMARKHLTERLGYYAQRYGISYKNLRINGAQTRWGSCNAQRKSLNFTWRLIMAPPVIVDYVVVHELCHLRHANHSAAFWTEVEGIMPDYKQRRKWLKENGMKLRV